MAKLSAHGSEQGGGSGWPVWLGVLSIVTVTAAAYSNSFQGVFLLDDWASILENKSIVRLWPIGPVLFGAKSPTVIGRPLLNLSLALNYAWGGTNVWGYHAVNLAVHILAGLALFGVVRRTLWLPQMSEHVRRDATGLALAIALIWSVHPVQTESVTYIVQRAESLVGVCYFTMIYCVIRGATSAWPVPWYAAAVMVCAVGTATKEVMATAPVIVLVYDRVFLEGSFREVFRKRWGLYAACVGTWVELCGLMASSQGRRGTAGFGNGMSSWDYAMTQFGAIVGYLRLCFWPDPLMLDYGMKVARTPGEIVPWALVILLLLAGTVLAFRFQPWIGFLGVWFFVILAPSSSIVPLVTQTIAEHRMYLPLAGVVALFVMGVYFVGRRIAMGGEESDTGQAVRTADPTTLQRVHNSKWDEKEEENPHAKAQRRKDEEKEGGQLGQVHRAAGLGDGSTTGHRTVRTADPTGLRFALGVLLLAVIAVLGVRTFLRNREYHSALALWEEHVRLDPTNFRTHSSLGMEYLNAGNPALAIRQFDVALELNPEHTISWVNRGVAHTRLGEHEAAIADASQAIEVNPRYSAAYLNRANAYAQLGRYEEAIRDATRTIEFEPDFAPGYATRGMALQRLGRHEEAITDFGNALRLSPADVTVYNARGVSRKSLGQVREAIADYSRAIELAPRFAEAFNNRGAAYGELGESAKALADFTKAIELAPDVAAAYRNRAICHYDLKQFDAAWEDVRMFQKLGGTPNPKFIQALEEATEALELKKEPL